MDDPGAKPDTPETSEPAIPSEEAQANAGSTSDPQPPTSEGGEGADSGCSQGGLVTAPLLVGLCALTLLGLVLRLYGLGGGLRLDEFGTLWVVRDGLGAAVERTLAWQVQSPFYYVLAWVPFHALGPSELALRLPSVLFGGLTAIAGALAAREIAGRRAALLAGSFLWLDPFLLVRSTNARPYALGAACVALFLLGFLRATRRDDPWARALFVAGGVGSVYAHYLLALPAAGVGIAYCLAPSLRARYAPRRFAFDVTLQLVAVLPILPALGRATGRAHLWHLPMTLGHAGRVILGTIALPLLLAGAGVFAARLWGRTPPAPASGEAEEPSAAGSLVSEQLALLAAALSPALVLGLLAALTNNGFLLSHRYLTAAVVPAAVLAACTLAGAACLPRRVVVAGWLVVVLAFFGHRLQREATFSGVPQAGWRQAVDALHAAVDARKAPAADALVLYRSGFMDDELHVQGEHDAATLAPLRSPGQPVPAWDVVGLSYGWGSQAHERFLHERVLPRVRAQREVWLLIRGPADERGYASRLEAWLRKQLGACERVEVPLRSKATRGEVVVRRLRFTRPGLKPPG